jgi:asparagine synthase (glutamine-hydrolysing)
MSGICGLFNLDNAPVADGVLRSMTAMLEKRGPERTGRWRDGSTALGHTLLATTPELMFERQPFKHAETGCVITADVRLDNREELLAAFGLSDRSESVGDAELILLAHLKWGEECVDRLLGDFAFGIWDQRHRKLFCARDHFGMRPFYYHHAPGKRFLFASDARAILVLPQVPYRINEGRVADFLVPELEWIDYTSTFFEDVYRLPPGHKATVTPDGMDVVEYWQPQPGPELHFKSDEEYQQGFLEVFTHAVEARLRAPSGTVGSMLSGGIDSGSVVAVAKELLAARRDGPLKTFSAVSYFNSDGSDNFGCTESHAIHAAVSAPSISATLVHPDALEDIIEQLISGNEEPFDGECMILKAIYLAARGQGMRVVLDGAGGDILLAEGSYILRLIRQRRFTQAMTEIVAEHRYWDEGLLVSRIIHHARAAIVPEAIKKVLRGPRRRHKTKGYLKESLISSDFARSIDIENRFERMRCIFPDSWEHEYAVERCNAIWPNVTAGRERYARIAAATGTEARDPFLDKRVVEYCSRLPGRFRLKNGWPKIILREIMSDKLPHEVLWTRRKPHLGSLFNDAVTKRALHRSKLDIVDLDKGLRGYVDPVALAAAWKSFREGGDGERIHSAHVLSVWLKEFADRPVVPE